MKEMSDLNDTNDSNETKEKNDEKNEPYTFNNKFFCGNYVQYMMCSLILIVYTNIILIVFKLILFIVSIYYCFSGVTMFYLLNIFAIIFAGLYLLLFLTLKNKKYEKSKPISLFPLLLWLLILIIYVCDIVSYILYSHQNISQSSPLVLLIINDILFAPSIYLGLLST